MKFGMAKFTGEDEEFLPKLEEIEHIDAIICAKCEDIMVFEDGDRVDGCIDLFMQHHKDCSEFHCAVKEDDDGGFKTVAIFENPKAFN